MIKKPTKYLIFARNSSYHGLSHIKSIRLLETTYYASMKNIEISIRISVLEYEELHPMDQHLVNEAKHASQSAYAPYSSFKVGTAVLLENGTTVTGNNQENAAYPSGLCAERVAIFSAHALYPEQKIDTIAIAACYKNEFTETISPCGACRQVMLESEKRSGKVIRILLFGINKILVIESVKDLMPLTFQLP